jgi:cytochrome c biogenesis protein CcdA
MVRVVTELAVESVRPKIETAVKETARDVARRAVFVVFGLILLACVVVFAELALYLWLRTQMAPPYAALVVAGVALLLMLFAFLIAFAGGGKSKPGRATDTDPTTLQAEASATARVRFDAEELANLAGSAEELGKMLGKNASGTQLVLGAFLVGMLLGRDK